MSSALSFPLLKINFSPFSAIYTQIFSIWIYIFSVSSQEKKKNKVSKNSKKKKKIRKQQLGLSVSNLWIEIIKFENILDYL